MNNNLLEMARKKGLYQSISDKEKNMIEDLERLVKIPSLATEMDDEGMPCGPEITRALEEALDISKRMGFNVYNENNKYGWAEVGEGDQLLCIFVHLDIVPVGEGWTKEPFKITREDGKLYGRGILDNKGPAVACMYALKTCCELVTKFPLKIRIWFGTNEENGMNDIQMYIKKYGAPNYAFVPDSQFPLSFSELGTTKFILRKHLNISNVNNTSDVHIENVYCEPHANGIPTFVKVTLAAKTEEILKDIQKRINYFSQKEKIRTECELSEGRVCLTVYGIPAYHWNEPWTAKNPLAYMVLFLNTIDLGEDANEIIDFVSTNVGTETDGKLLGIDVTTETATLSIALQNMKIDQFGIEFSFFMISPAEERVEIILNSILRKTRKEDIELCLKSFGPAFLLDKDMPLLKMLYESYTQVSGLNEQIKVCGGTYSKFIPSAVPFGAIFTEETDICHTPNEFIYVKDFILWAQIYADAILRIADSVR